MNSMYKVCVRSYTYNHAQYIEDAMNGFVMQKTDFPFVSAIVDDASTDNEAQVILDYFNKNFDTNDSSLAFREEADYGTVMFARHKANLNCYFAVVLLKENHRSRRLSKLPYIRRWINDVPFVALCEGDDYWTDPFKLQTQVDFLERHKEYSLCCHRYRIYNQNTDTWDDDYVKRIFDSHPEGFSFTRSDNLKTWITKTMTLVYRKDRYHPEEMTKYRLRCDEHLNYHLLSHGLGYCFPFVGAVYRRTDSGVFAPLPERTKRMRGVLIRSELLSNNLEDNDLREDVFSRIKKYLNKDCSLKGMMKPIGICLKSFYLTEGLMSSLRVAKKFLASFLKGAHAKHRVKVS